MLDHRRWLSAGGRGSLPFSSTRADAGADFRAATAGKARALAENYAYESEWAIDVTRIVRDSDEGSLGTFLVASALLGEEGVLPQADDLTLAGRRTVSEIRQAAYREACAQIIRGMVLACVLACVLLVTLASLVGFWSPLFGPGLVGNVLSTLSGGATAFAACGRFSTAKTTNLAPRGVLPAVAAGVLGGAATWFVAPLAALAFWAAWTVYRDIEDYLFRLEEVGASL